MSKRSKNKGVKRLANPEVLARSQRLFDNSSRLDSSFEISIRYSLEKNYSFKKLTNEGIIAFHQFIEKTVGKSLSWQQVDKMYLRTKNGNPFRDETIDGIDRRVTHYDISKSGRIFGYREGDDFIIWKIDPNHEVDD